MNSEELKRKKEEYLKAKEEYKADAERRKAERLNAIKIRDAVLDANAKVLDEIKTEIFKYNSLGKKAKSESKILEVLEKLLEDSKHNQLFPEETEPLVEEPEKGDD